MPLPDIMQLPGGASGTLVDVKFQVDSDEQDDLARVAGLHITFTIADDGHDIEACGRLIPGADIAIRAGMTTRLQANLENTGKLPQVKLCLTGNDPEGNEPDAIVYDGDADMLKARIAIRGPVATATYHFRVHDICRNLAPLLVHLGQTVGCHLQARGQLELSFGAVEDSETPKAPHVGDIVSARIIVPDNEIQMAGMVEKINEEDGTAQVNDLDGVGMEIPFGAIKARVRVVAPNGGRLDDVVQGYCGVCRLVGMEPSWSHLLVGLGRIYGAGAEMGSDGSFALTTEAVEEALTIQAQEAKIDATHVRAAMATPAEA